MQIRRPKKVTGKKVTGKKEPVQRRRIHDPEMITIDPDKVNISSISYKKTDQYGFGVGTDTSIIAKHLFRGYPSRREMVDNMRKEIKRVNGLKTSSGTEKNISSLSHAVIRRLLARGYVIESLFVMRKPEEIQPSPINKRKSIKRI